MTAAPAKRYDLVMATSQLPVIDDPRSPAAVRWRVRPGDATAALRAVLAARDGAWVGWDGRNEGTGQPFTLDKLPLHPLHLAPADVDNHLRGYCARTLAPLYHDCLQPPIFRKSWREAYAAVNRRIARVVGDIVAPGGVVWVHDHQLQLVPGHLRRLRPDVLTGFFLHSVFPPQELFVRLPMREQLLLGILGADLVGFQHHRAVRNFLDSATRVLRLPTTADSVTVDGRRVRVGAFPMSVDVAEMAELAGDPCVRSTANALRTSLGNPRTVFLGVGRMTHADGIEQTLDAYAELLADRRLDPSRAALVQLAVPDDDGGNDDLRARIDRRVGQINGTYARIGRPVVHYLHRDLDRTELAAMYLAADVLVATPLRAGATLAANEFIAARTDGTGQLVLSEFTGTAEEIPEALVVNPHDTDAVKEAMLAAAGAVTCDPGAASAMHAMRRRLREEDLNAWAGGFLSALGGCVASSFRAQTATTPSRVARSGTGPLMAPWAPAAPADVTQQHDRRLPHPIVR